MPTKPVAVQGQPAKYPAMKPLYKDFYIKPAATARIPINKTPPLTNKLRVAE